MSLEIVCDGCGKRHTFDLQTGTIRMDKYGLPWVVIPGWGTLRNEITGVMHAHACSKECGRKISNETKMGWVDDLEVRD